VEPAGSETRRSELPVTRDTTQIEIKPAPEQFGGSRLRDVQPVKVPRACLLKGSGGSEYDRISSKSSNDL
jgi:hypothetical protein